MATAHKSLNEAISAVMKEVGYVQKTGQVAFGNTKYTYAGEADLIHSLRPAMIKHGIDVYCAKYDLIHVSESKRIISSHWTFTHAHSKDTRTVMALGEGEDRGDKGIYKAQTGALKYALRQTFLIETGDDPDKTSSDELWDKNDRAEYDRVQKELLTCDDPGEVWQDNIKDIKRWESKNLDFYDGLVNAGARRRKELEAEQIAKDSYGEGMINTPTEEAND